MTTNVIPWLILIPLLAVPVVPVVGAIVPTWRSPLYTLAHLGILLIALAALDGGPGRIIVDVQRGPLALQLGLALDRSGGLALVVAAVIFLTVGWFSQEYVQGARNAGVFLSLLLVAQATVSLVLLASDLLALYAGLLTLSLVLMLMIGLDFGPSGGAAALRVFATIEVPAAFAFAGLWLIRARAGTLALSDLARDTAWLRDPISSVLVVPIVVALISRAGLTPLHNWVVAGCRAAAAPVAIAIVGIAVPVGGLVLGRLADTAIPLGSTWLDGLAILGAATAVVAGIGATRERSALGWLGYLAVGQVGLATVGFVAGGSTGQVSAPIGLAVAALATSLIGMSVGLAIRATGRDRVDSLTDLARVPAVRWPFLIGLVALAPLPPLPTFTARRLLLAGLLSGGSDWEYVTAALVILGTIALAVPVWRIVFDLAVPSAEFRDSLTPYLIPDAGAFTRPSQYAGEGSQQEYRPEDPSPVHWGKGLGMRELIPSATEKRLAGPTVGLAASLVLLGLVPLSLLIGPLESGTAPFASVVAGATVILAVGGASTIGYLKPRGERLQRAGRVLSWLGRRGRLDLALDPYVLIGSLLLAVGRLSAITLDETFGRLARAR